MRLMSYRLRAEARGRWRAWAGLALAMALTGGIVMAAGAGSRRTASAYPRLLTAVAEQDAEVALPSPQHSFNDRNNPWLGAVDRLPQVESSAGLNQLLAFSGDHLDASSTEQDLWALADGYGTRISRPLLRAGRMPDPHRIDEALIDPSFARDRHLAVGSRFTVTTVDSDALDAVNDQLANYRGPRQSTTLTVTGIGQIARDINPTTVLEDQAHVYVTPAFLDARPASLVNAGTAVRLRPGEDVGAFQSAVEQLARSHGIDQSAVYFTAERDHTRAVARSVRPEALGLALLGLVVGLAGLLVLGQALSRQAFVDASESPLLGSIGMTRRQRFGLGLARVGAVSVIGSIGAVLIAIALSPLFPIGPARATEPSPGFAIDAPVLGLGLVVTVTLFVIRGSIPAWRGAARAWRGAAEPAGREQPSRLAALLARLGGRPESVIGVRMAFEPGRGRTALPVRSTLVTTSLAMAAVVAVATFSGNLGHLVGSPPSYGWTWTASTGLGFDPAPPAATARLVGDSSLSGVAGGNYLDLRLGRQDVPAVTIDSLKGNVEPRMLEGHAPRGNHDLVLGTETMRSAGLRIGQRVAVELNGAKATMQIVGRAVFPRLGAGIFTPTDVGQGAALTNAAATEAGVETLDPSDPGSKYSVYFLQAAPGVSLAALQTQLGRQLDGLMGECPGQFCVMGPQRPGEIVAYGRVRSTAVALIALLAVMAAGALAHSLVTSVRRRRHDVAVLKTLGFSGRQLGSTARWQALALTAAALAIGLPLGLIGGRWAWILFARQLGVAPSASLPLEAVLAVVATALLASIVIATVPATMARRTVPARLLMSP